MYVGNKITGEVVFMPPKVEEVQTLVQNLLEWINQEKELNPVLLAGLAHYEFVRIHPFVDGNGRTARALATSLWSFKSSFSVILPSSWYFSILVKTWR